MKDYAFEHLPGGYELYEIVDLSGRQTADAGRTSSEAGRADQAEAAREETGSGENLETSSKTLAVSGLAIIAAMALYGLYVLKHPFSEAFSMSNFQIAFAIAAMIIGLVAYIFLHEGVHGFFIKMFSGRKPFYGKDLKAGMFYAGSRCFFTKSAYVAIALSPFVIWGIVLALLLRDLAVAAPQFWWYLYAIQMFNFSGAVGDLYITWRMLRMPKGVLVQDDGIVMRFYVPRGTVE